MSETTTDVRALAAERIRDPRTLLAAGLVRLLEADRLHQRLFADECVGREEMVSEEIVSAVEIAGAYATLAEGALSVQREEREASRTAAVADVSDQFAADLAVAPEREYAPQPVQGVRFRMDLHPARGQYMGMIGGSEWFHLPGHGFINISTAEQSGPDNAHELTGRIVSATPDHIIGITDGGVGVTLPRALVIETEDR